PAVVTTLRSGGGCGVAAAWPNSENGLASDRVRDEGHRFGAWMDKEMGRRWFRARPSCPAKAGHPVSADVLSNAASVVLDHPLSRAMTGERLMLQLGSTLNAASVFFVISSRETSGASSISVMPPDFLSMVKTPRSVITI